MAELPVVKAGDTFTVSCPAGSKPQLEAGEKIPAGDKPAFVVLNVKDNAVVLGPLLPGELKAAINCEGAGVITAHATLEPVPAQQLPDREAPLPPINFAFPMWFWILVCALVLLIASSIVLFFVRRSHLQKQKLKAPVEKALSPDEAFERFLRSLDKGTPDTRTLYTQANDLLRANLEYRLEFEASFGTTREFMGMLSAAVQKRGIRDGELMPMVEGVLTTCDSVRFADDQPSAETKTHFIDTLRKLTRKLPPKPLPPQGVIK